MTRYALIGALSAVIGLLGWVYVQNTNIDRLKAENASYQRSIKALETTIEQSALAREVERARAERWQERATTLNATIEAILSGDVEDEILDPRIADFINSLHDD